MIMWEEKEIKRKLTKDKIFYKLIVNSIEQCVIFLS